MIDTLKVQYQPISSNEKFVSISSIVDEKENGDETSSEDLNVGTSAVNDALKEMENNSKD